MFQTRLKELREAAGYKSQQSFADAFGVAQSTVGNWEAGKREPNYETTIRLAQFFKVPVGYLLGIEESGAEDVILTTLMDNNMTEAVELLKEQRRKKIVVPVLGDVAAGLPMYAEENIIDYEELSPDIVRAGEEYFGLRIRGRSMEPRMLDGDVVIVRKQETADNGDIAVVLVNGDSATVKKIKKGPDGLMLIPNNPAFEPMFYSNEDIQSLPVAILGKVVEIRGKF